MAQGVRRLPRKARRPEDDTQHPHIGMVPHTHNPSTGEVETGKPKGLPAIQSGRTD